MTTPDHAHIHVHCDTCTGEHELEFPISPEYTIQEAANLFLVAMGWETYRDRLNDTQRHRCVACVTLRYALEKARREVEQRNALARLDQIRDDGMASLERMKDGHS